jgi:uroporphyrinogen-III synthase
MGHEPVVQPLIETRLVPVASDALVDAGALAFTSQSAIDAAVSQGLVPALTDLPVFAVGDATADAARRAGFQRVQSAAGSVSDLATLILASPPSWAGDLVHLSARQPAGDLTALLQKRDYPARRVILYETIAAPVDDIPEGAEAVLIHSAMAAGRLAVVISPSAAENMCLFGLSEAALMPLNAIKFRQRAVAPIANEASILSLLD